MILSIDSLNHNFVCIHIDSHSKFLSIVVTNLYKCLPKLACVSARRRSYNWCYKWNLIFRPIESGANTTESRTSGSIDIAISDRRDCRRELCAPIIAMQHI